MGVTSYLKDCLTLASILGLLLAGLTIALESGVVIVGPERKSEVMVNLSKVLLTLAGCLLILGMIQRVVGVRIDPIW